MGHISCSIRGGGNFFVLTKTLTETHKSHELCRNAEDCIEKSEYARATALLDDALKIVPKNAVYMSHKGYCTAMLGMVSEGESMCRRAIQVTPYTPILYVNLGRILLSQGKRHEARQEFLHAYELDDTDAAAGRELLAMGVRRTPPIPFLERTHPVNIWLGKLRYRLKQRKQSG